MKVGPHVMTNRDIVPRVGSGQGNLKLIQCQLMLLLHARRCEQRNEMVKSQNVASSVRAILLNCPVRHCRAMKEVLNHMKSCRLSSSCTYQHCTTSLRILSHWTNCSVEECPLCGGVRERMRRAKEWEATLPRTSKYTLLAAALRSSQTPRPSPPNCNVAEQASEGRSGVPNQEEKQTSDKQSDKSIPSAEQVRKAYEQLGIPCPPEALQRLMTTLPKTEDKMDTDQGIFDCNSNSPEASPNFNQLPAISSTSCCFKKSFISQPKPT